VGSKKRGKGGLGGGWFIVSTHAQKTNKRGEEKKRDGISEKVTVAPGEKKKTNPKKKKMKMFFKMEGRCSALCDAIPPGEKNHRRRGV